MKFKNFKNELLKKSCKMDENVGSISYIMYKNIITMKSWSCPTNEMLKTKDEKMKNQVTQSSIMQPSQNSKRPCNFVAWFLHGHQGPWGKHPPSLEET